MLARMNTGNLITLTIIFSLALLIFQRIERRRLWMAGLLLVLPVGFLSWRWAIYKGQVQEMLTAAGAALALNVIFWLVYGRRHPPGSSDSITVIGTDE